MGKILLISLYSLLKYSKRIYLIFTFIIITMYILCIYVVSVFLDAILILTLIWFYITGIFLLKKSIELFKQREIRLGILSLLTGLLMLIFGYFIVAVINLYLVYML
jgi:hypothetical protein